MIVMSDFLEDDGTWKFVTDANLSDPVAARSLAERLAKQQLPWKESPNISLVWVESKDVAQASCKRQQAVVMFWRIYLSARLRQPVKVRN